MRGPFASHHKGQTLHNNNTLQKNHYLSALKNYGIILTLPGFNFSKVFSKCSFSYFKNSLNMFLLKWMHVNLSRSCAGFGWGRANIYHSGWYGAAFWICTKRSVDNVQMFLLLLRRAYTDPRPFPLFYCCASKKAWGG